ncbi:MAG: hypothetical protein G01um101425_455 [Candidatus Peregrinibacteria bacterium Gr01-1014_25]|nr:MAG: hypothetical protein G01um101425_455 [Candidatus Peregrinibacteria bacterium Gr01-1014_25]
MPRRKSAARTRPPAPSALRILGKVAIAAFVLWHIAAIGIFSVPVDDQGRLATAVRTHATPWVSRYVLTTSQWQQWNLFSPDPLRRVTFYRIEAQRDDAWHELTTLQPGSYPLWRHANMFKLLINIMEGNNPALTERFLSLLCREHLLVQGTGIRVRYLVTIIPWSAMPMSPRQWHAWNPTFETLEGPQISCPDPSSL